MYNSVFEIKLRILIILAETTLNCLSEDMILAVDFMAIYGKEFLISNNNLHGDNTYKYSEIANRKLIVKEAIKELVLGDLINVDMSDGYKYFISDSGIDYVRSFENEYSIEFSKCVDKVFEIYSNKHDYELLKIIQSKSTCERRNF